MRWSLMARGKRILDVVSRRRFSWAGRLRPLAGSMLLGVALLLAGRDTAVAHDGSLLSIDGKAVESFRSAVSFLSDCDGTRQPPRCGGPLAKWSLTNRVVAMCTVQANRPAWLTPELFASTIRDAAARWGLAEAAIAIRYAGDCVPAVRLFHDQRNEISFDDARNVARGTEAAVTQSGTSWSPPTNPTVRTIEEADIVLADGFPSLEVCFLSVLVHEMGHVLGLGHSGDTADIMYPTYDSESPSSCKTQPSPAEVAAVQQLYGVNRAPTVRLIGPASVEPGATVSLLAEATDLEGDPLNLEWKQLSGPPVTLNLLGSTANFTAPTSAPAGASSVVLSFSVTAVDRYLHTATSTAQVPVTTQTTGATRAAVGIALPPTGFGLFVFTGGTGAQLLAASGCPAATAAFWATDASGTLVTYVPASTVALVNAGWLRLFPLGVPPSTALIGSCRRATP